MRTTKSFSTFVVAVTLEHAVVKLVYNNMNLIM